MSDCDDMPIDPFSAFKLHTLIGVIRLLAIDLSPGNSSVGMRRCRRLGTAGRHR
jgi:hypothetical protein